ncbi:MAG: MATE family efflux transporter [bacterium]
MEEPTAGRDLTKGSILGNVLYMGIPSMIGFAAMTVYALTDMFWVARLGTAQVAAITLFGSFLWVLTSINSLVGSGSVAVISRRFGERDYDGAACAIEQTILMKVAVAIPMSIIGYFAVGNVLGFMTDDAEVVAYGMTYGRILFLGLPFMFSSYSVYTALRGMGEAPRAMYIMLFSTSLNIALDPLFIFRFNLGIAGAATATVISAVCAVAVGLYTLRSPRRVARIGEKGLRIDLRTMSRILQIGFPPFIESVARSLAHWVFAIFVAVFGTLIVASYGICMRIIEFGIVFAVGLELGASAIVGQNLGAHKPDRAEASARNAAFLALAIAVTLSVIEVLFAEEIMMLFGRSDEVRVMGAHVLRYFAVAQPLIATSIALSSAFYGSGKTWPPTIGELVATWAFQIPVAALLIYTLGRGADSMWTAVILSKTLFFSILVLWYRKGTWKEEKV